MSVRIVILALFVVGQLTQPRTAGAVPLPVGPQFQVNTYTTSHQYYPAVAADGSGGFVVVWESWESGDSDSSDDSVHGRRYDADGTPRGAQFQVNTYTTSHQGNPAVAADGSGGFVVVWSSFGGTGSDTDDSSIQGQRYDAGGTPQGAQFQVNTYTTNDQYYPAVAAASAGDFIVVWVSLGSPGSDTGDWSIQGRRFDAGGAPRDSQFQVNTYTTDDQLRPAIAAAAAGNFVVVWDSYGGDESDGEYLSIHARRYAADGTPHGEQFQVNTYTTDNQENPAVAAAGAGSFVVVWESYGSAESEGDYSSIQARRYDASGAPQGAEFEVSTDTESRQFDPSVAADGTGSFAVVWVSAGDSESDGSSGSIQGRYYDADGTASPEVRVNASPSLPGETPVVAADHLAGAGDFVVAWSDELYGYQDGDLGGIFARRFAEPTTTSSSSTSTSTRSSSSTSSSSVSTTSSSSDTTATSTSTTSSSTSTTTSTVPCSRADDEGAGCDDGDPCTADDRCAGGICKGQPFCSVAPLPSDSVPANQGVSVDVSAEPGATVEAGLFEPLPLPDAVASRLGSRAATPEAEAVGESLSKPKSKKVKRKGRVVLKLKLNRRGRELLNGAPNGALRVVLRTTVRHSGREASLIRLLTLLRKRR
jgi:hypothetical protein